MSLQATGDFMVILILSVESEGREDGKGCEQKWGKLHFSWYHVKTPAEFVIPEIKYILTVQSFITNIQRGFTWRVKFLSDIYIWADICTFGVCVGLVKSHGSFFIALGAMKIHIAFSLPEHFSDD